MFASVEAIKVQLRVGAAITKRRRLSPQAPTLLLGLLGDITLNDELENWELSDLLICEYSTVTSSCRPNVVVETNALLLIGRCASRDIVRFSRSRQFSSYTPPTSNSHGFSRDYSANMAESCAPSGEGCIYLPPMPPQPGCCNQVDPSFRRHALPPAH
jgi:hypothetical protein